MKKQKKMFIVFAILILAGIFFGYKHQPAKESELTADKAAAETSINNSGLISNRSISIKSSNASGVQMPSFGTKAMRMAEALSSYNDEPIIFYGKIEDQFSNPVVNATVKFGVRVDNGFESTVKRGQVASDFNGLFKISGYKGQDLGIGVEKTGYAWVSMNGSSIYSKLWPDEQRSHPDPKNPTIIKMWKLQGAEPLLNINQRYKIPYTNAPIYFDLLAGKVVADSGDLKITVNRPDGNISGKNRQDWGFAIEAVNGGLIENTFGESQVTYAAPESGYQQSCTLTASANKHGIQLIQQEFFVRSRDGQIYSRLFVSFDINSNPQDLMSISFRGVANTNGSRNWEATASQ